MLKWMGRTLFGHPKKITYLEYYIQKDVNSRPFTVHADDMEPFEGPRHPESWLNANNCWHFNIY